MGEPKTKSAMANQSHAGSGGYQDSYGMEDKAARHAVEASGDPSVDQALQEGEASADKKQAAVERQDKDYTPSSDEAGTPANYDGPATRTRATSDSPPDPYTTEVPEPPSNM